jgi:hypothetical protein
MMAFKIALYLLILGAVMGAVGGAMSYTSTNWFPGTNFNTVANTSSISQSQLSSLNPSENDISDVGGVVKTLSIGSVVWSALSGILYIEPIIAHTIVVPDPSDPKKNLFEPFAMIIQAGIYLMYGIGLYQCYSKFMITYGA